MGPDDRKKFDLLTHADWSKRAEGRWLAHASRSGGGWRIEAARPVGDPGSLVCEIKGLAGSGAALLGVDLPIGAPIAWAAAAAVDRYLDALPAFGHGAWSRFYDPATAPDEISLTRPFYPASPGGARQRHLTEALGVPDMHALRRRCDLDAGGKPAATPLFWTLGAAQVGKAALDFWRSVLAPATAAETAWVWPFDGDLAALGARGGVVIAETYPGEVYNWFELDVRHANRSKRRQTDRANDADRMLAAGARLGAAFAPAAEAQVRTGFPDGGDDAFDAMVGLLGLLQIVEGGRPEGAPDDAEVRMVEGWILGREPAPG